MLMHFSNQISQGLLPDELEIVHFFERENDRLQKECILCHLLGKDPVVVYNSWMIKFVSRKQHFGVAYNLWEDSITKLIDDSMAPIKLVEISKWWQNVAKCFTPEIREQLNSNIHRVDELLRAFCNGLNTLRGKMEEMVNSANIYVN